MYTTSYKIRQAIYDIRRRWRIRALKQGFSILVFTFLFFFSSYLLIEYKFDISPFFRGLGITIAAIAILFVLIQYLLRPAFKRLDDKKIALFIEEQLPDLEDRLNSAVELNKNYLDKGKNIIVDNLIDDMDSKTRKIELSNVVNRKKVQVLSYISNISLAVFLILLYSFYDDLKSAAAQIDITLNPITELEQDFISITPGDVELEKGESQDIIVEMKQDTEEDVILHYSFDDKNWRKKNMEKGLDRPVFITQFEDIQNPINYYMELNQKSTPQFKISIYDFPKVTKIDLKYEYPEYTGIPDRIEENSGDIRGPKDSKVTLTIEANKTAIAGEMIVENSKKYPLIPAGEGRFLSTILLNDTGFYYINLTDGQNKNNKYPEEYQIIPVEDEIPIIVISDPKKDVKVNMVEEVLVTATVSDDYGISDFNLIYSLNGDNEETITLLKGKTKRVNEVSGSYIFFLEDFDLHAGDVFSYYLDAKDNCKTNDVEYSDMYFIEVTSLNTKYTQVRNRGGGGGGGRQSQTVINQQKIISATWKLEKTKKRIAKREFTESLEAISSAQQKLKESIEERIESSGRVMEIPDETTKKVEEYYKKAVKEMEDALEELSSEDLKPAVKEEQQALNNILSAEALNDEQRVQRQQRGSLSGGGGGGSNNQEMMDELQDLELDITKDKYEMQQQRSGEQQDIDETLQKVEELAKKQQRLAERSRQNLREESEKRFLDRLKRDQEQLRQDAENLTNQMRRQSRDNQQLSREMQQNMENAAESMRKAEDELKNNNPQEAISHQQTAINELNKLKQDLQLSQADNYRAITESFIDNFEEFKQKEQNLDKDLNQTFEDSWQNPQKKINVADLERLRAKREDSMKNLEQIENQSKTLEESTRREQPEISTTMRNFQKNLKRENLERYMKSSKESIEQGWLSYALTNEYRIQESIERLEGQVRKLEKMIPMGEEEKLERSLKDVRELLRKYNEIRDEAGQRNQAGLSQQNQNNDQSNREGNNRSGGQNNSEQQGQGQRAQAARLQRQVDRMQQQLDNIQRSGGGDQNSRSALESVRNNMRSLHNTGVLLDEAGLEYFKKNVYDPLSKLELQLNTKMDEIKMEKKLHGSRKADIPAQYRKMVDKYYESISKSKNSAKK